jgi:hypothetical protein
MDRVRVRNWIDIFTEDCLELAPGHRFDLIYLLSTLKWVLLCAIAIPYAIFGALVWLTFLAIAVGLPLIAAYFILRTAYNLL